MSKITTDVKNIKGDGFWGYLFVAVSEKILYSM